ncbi:hypothetical protein DYB28_007629 [Aphanomyces astaci]|uniref:Uncharacterized protein n=1 Tax=Aphanomyces astaci TaxID=112090 RepID=A0A397FEG8_APHAT|nr:hypothetical protein DYB36_008559 [Aphanomyces astaci]RHY17133.1 hypothetical protein DYB25_005745 [Aphanomyces astaci]RHY48205.1 hypothetical protein DYB34_004987 [Aphanomyces astaci]RHY74445.1 hypothetical protein DYB30_009443 [Aphanomyces astaci]RHY76526.1 hypothetical protein DYB38_000875 [Aphanomyces astaci]
MDIRRIGGDNDVCDVQAILVSIKWILAPASSAVPCKWELSYTLATEAATELAAPSIQLTLGQPEKTIAFDLDVHTFRVLRQELHAARALMASSASHVE